MVVDDDNESPTNSPAGRTAATILVVPEKKMPSCWWFPMPNAFPVLSGVVFQSSPDARRVAVAGPHWIPHITNSSHVSVPQKNEYANDREVHDFSWGMCCIDLDPIDGAGPRGNPARLRSDLDIFHLIMLRTHFLSRP